MASKDGDGDGDGDNRGGGTFSFEPADVEAVEATDTGASAGDGEGTASGSGGGGAVAYPSTPRLVCEPESPPDTEENVRHQADGIFRSFVFERFARDRQEGRLDPGTPDSPELARERPNPMTQEARIGRQLAEIGDDIQRRYRSQFMDMIQTMESELTDSEASFDVFRKVAAGLFRDGVISWGRVVALFFFGYRVAVEKIRHGVSGFLRQIVAWICRFLVTERIARWIADHGGWRSVWHMTPYGEEISVNWRHLACLGLLVTVCIVAFRYSRRQ